MKMLTSRILLCTIPVLVAACTSTPIEPPKEPPRAAPAATAPAPPAASLPAPVAPVPALVAHLDPKNMLYRERSVYFDYDGSALREQDKRIVEAHGTYLASNPALHVRVEGNTDERGSSEYNLALGQRRAEVVKSALLVIGVRDAQIEAVSFGKEKPRATAHEEAAWAQNRRADIAYPVAAR
jgi:peptidoglycan-associated lipoprotein